MNRKVGGREATTGVIPGRHCLSVGKPDIEAPEGWAWHSLSDLARLESGHTPSRRKPEYWGGDVSWIGIKDATGNHGRVLHETIQHTNELGIANSAARILPANTVCLSRTASVGYVVVMGRPMATSQDFANWVCGPDLDYNFLKYALLVENEALHRFSYGSTHRTIYYPELKAFHICAPNLAEQREITAVLGALDDKIELNRKTAATLEDMARALYRSWFVDFDPVAAKSEGRVPVHMDEATASLFPDTFTEDGLPEGWNWHTFENSYTVLETGKRPKGGVASVSDGVPSVGAESIKNIGVFDFGKTKFVPRDFFQSMKKGRLADGDILIYKDGGKPGELRPAATYVSEGFPFGEACINEHVFRIRLDDTLGQHFGFLALSSDHCMHQMRELATGVAQPGLNQSAMKALSYLRPSNSEILAVFNKLVSPLLDGCNEKAKESLNLATLRDTLLPKLMSGELRVPAARDVVEEAV